MRGPFGRAPARGCLAFGAALLLASCTPDAGLDGSDILVPYESLAGGILFSTAAIVGSDGYELYWVGVPPPGSVASQFPRLVLEAPGDQSQPAVSAGGKAIAFVGENGIYLISNSGRVKQLSSPDGSFVDSLPAVSADGTRVAWVREDRDKPIGQTGFFQAEIWMSMADGSGARALSPKTGVVQDAPAFTPNPNKSQIAWTELSPESIAAGFGPTNYGVFVFDYDNDTGDYMCRAVGGETPNTDHLPFRSDRGYRCFGQHLAWPVEETLVLSQDFLEVSTVGAPLASTWSNIVAGLQSQQVGVPFIDPPPGGFPFFPAFPLSASYAFSQSGLIYVFDGVISALDGDSTTLALFIAQNNGDNVRRVGVEGLNYDVDTIGTANYLFSRATPQLVPFQTE